MLLEHECKKIAEVKDLKFFGENLHKLVAGILIQMNYPQQTNKL